MTSTPKPFLSEAIALSVQLATEEHLELRPVKHSVGTIALALSDAYSRGLEDAANHCAIAATNAIFDAAEDALYKAAFDIRALGSK